MEDVLLNVLERKADDQEIFVDLHYKDKSFVPLVKNNVAYIVSGLIFNENDEILLMQEAKTSCYGKWYLPAGRMEANETIEDAVKREVLEETGIICTPQSLSSIEISNLWYRFNMISKMAGGTLKKTMDKESLQAEWFSIDNIFNNRVDLRHTDILKVIDRSYKQHKNKEFIPMRPINIPHNKIIMRLLIVHCKDHSERFSFLMGKKPLSHLPSFEMLFFKENYRKLFQNIFGPARVDVELKTVLTVEHNGKPRHKNDGLVITALGFLEETKKPKILHSNDFEWVSVENDRITEDIKKFLNGDSVLLHII